MQHLVTGYLQNLPESTYSQLYEQPASCLAVYRSPISNSEINGWCTESAQSALQYALEQCKSLKCLLQTESHFRLNESFRIQFRNALTGGGESRSFGSIASAPDRHPIDVAFLDRYAKDQWESVLRYMVGKHDARPHTAVVNLLEKSGLMIRKSAHEEPAITYRGFQFLLQDVNSQVWALLLQYLSLAEELGMEEVDVLNFLFLLCSLELGSGYSSDALSPTQLSVLADMIAFGIVYRRKKKAKRFYPTRLATTLTSGKAAILHTSEADPAGYILVETNFRVYAYTCSDLQIAILHLFVQVKTRFPNFVIGIMTHATLQAAYRKGISAAQIIHFLKENAHPRMRHTPDILPPTVIDQLVLWEIEMHRIQLFPAKLIVDFPRQEEFLILKQFATSIDALVWSDEKKWKMVVKEEKYQSIVQHGQEIRKKRESLLLMKKKQAP